MKKPRKWRAWAVGGIFYPQFPPKTFRCRKDAEREAWSSSARGDIPTPIFRVEMRVVGRVNPTYYPTPPRVRNPNEFREVPAARKRRAK